MMKPGLPKPIQDLINQFLKLPGIGPKTSERFVFYLAQSPGELEALLTATQNLKQIRLCSECYNFSTAKICPICADKNRDHSAICVVVSPQDIMAIERAEIFKGIYHILGGTISGPQGVGPKDLRIKELIKRIRDAGSPEGSRKVGTYGAGKIQEVILAFNPNLEGETTILYLTKILKPYRIKITRLGRGLPMGGEIEYADEITLSDALKGRKIISNQ